LEVLAAVEVVPSVVTPNGDTINDHADISFHILGIDEARVEITIYDLSGRRVRRLFSERIGKGRYATLWNGTDGHGAYVPPGIYLCKMTVYTDTRTFESVKLLSVVY
jgi:flagellar hook assembly protein FlgD